MVVDFHHGYGIISGGGYSMKPKGWVGFILGIVLALLGLAGVILSGNVGSVIPLLVGIGLIFLGWFPGRTGLVIFGHACIVLGCFFITWGLYLLPYSKPVMLHIFTRPLFWGFFSLFGGICANYHGFCNCIRRQQ
jgi:hypothetical protein